MPQVAASRLPANDRIPYAALVIVGVFAIEGMSRSGAVLSTAQSAMFYIMASFLAPTIQSFGMSDAQPRLIFIGVAAIWFIVLAFFETAFLIVFRRATTRLRWLVRALAAVIGAAALLFTPAAPPMRLF